MNGGLAALSKSVAGQGILDPIHVNLVQPGMVEASEIRAFLRRKWSTELDYRLKKTLWCWAVAFEYEWHGDKGNWFRSYRNELWEFDYAGLMRDCIASINDAQIAESDRRLR